MTDDGDAGGASMELSILHRNIQPSVISPSTHHIISQEETMTDDGFADRRNGEVWCDGCGQHPRVVKWGYDGVEIRCECGEYTFVPHSGFYFSAPRSWKYKGRDGRKKKVNKND